MGAKSTIPTIADVRLASSRVAGRAVVTPLLSSAYFDELVGGRVFLKCETLQRTGSFKFRGACNAIAALDPKIREKGVVAVSSGNHAQGVAEAARLFGIRATIVMPSDAPAIKRVRTERSGAIIVDYDRKKEDRDAIAARVLAERGGTLVHPFNDPLVIAGQGTIGLEIVAECERHGITLDAVLVPCGGGGLSAGVGLGVRSEFADAEIWLVEPTGFDDYARSLGAGHPVANSRTSGSVCDALLAPAPGPIGFAINRENSASAIAVSDDDALRAVAFAFRELKLVVEPGGAVALAALLAGRFDVRSKTVVAVLSGGNIDETMLQRALALS